MKITDTNGVYSIVLGELEWYAVSEAGRQSTIDLAMQGARESERKYAAILVEPDAIMSVSPIATRHKVWGHTFPDSAEEGLRQAMADAFGTARGSGLTPKQIVYIAQSVLANCYPAEAA